MFGRQNGSSFNMFNKSASFILALFLLLSQVSSTSAQELKPAPVPASDTVQKIEKPVIEETNAKTVDESVKPIDKSLPKEKTPSEDAILPKEPQGEAMNSMVGPPALVGKTSESASNRLTSKIDNLTGSLVYEYKIVVPPGRNKMTPDVTLMYNSSSAENDGVIGSGWYFDIPSIERINRKGTNNLYTENYFLSSIDGELISIGSGAYVAKIEGGNFLKYQLTSNAWTVTDKEGTIYKFGTASTSRQDNVASTTQVFKWMINEVRDTNDNYIKYQYYKNAGQIYPSKIIYTGSGSTDGVLEVNFDRVSRSNAPTVYDTGFAVTSNYRISEIRTEVNDVWARKYTLAYTTGDNGSGSLLNTIVESGQDDSSTVVSLPAVDFDYKTATVGWTYNASTTLPIPFINGAVDAGARTADINGDGLIDLLCHNHKTADTFCPSASPKIYLNNGNGGWTDVSSTWLFPLKLGVGNDREAFTDDLYPDSGLRALDLNGDGLADLVRGYASTLAVYINNGSSWTYNAGLSFPLPFINSSNEDTGVRTADINGDGLLDVLCHNAKTTDTYCSNTTPKIYLNNGAGGWTDVSSTWLFPLIPGHATNREVFLKYSTSTSLVSDSTLRVVDLNGDNLDDLVRRSGASSYVFINNGSGWTYESSLSIPLPILDGSTDIGLRMSDVNGDGLVDILCHNDQTTGTYCTKSTPKIYLNNGYGGWTDVSGNWLFPVNPVASPDKVAFTDSSYLDTGLRALDLNGDGLTDLALANGATKKVFLNNGYTHSNLLIKISYVQGGNTSITYKPTTFYKDISNNILNPELPYVFDTVYQIQNNDGRGNTEEGIYEYKGGDYYFSSSLDRKLAGFRTVSKTTGKSKEITYYHQGNGNSTSSNETGDTASQLGLAYRTEVRNTAGNLYSQQLSDWNTRTLGNGAKFVNLNQSLTLNFDGDSDHKDVATSFVYSTSTGNLLSQTEWGEVTASTTGSFSDIGTDKRTTMYTYATNTVAYILGLPATERLNDQSGNKVREAKNYYDLQPLGSVTKGNVTKREEWTDAVNYIDNEWTYNSYGLPITQRDPRDKTTTLAYDSRNLFVATSTNADGHVVANQYDYTSGKIKRTKDPQGRIFRTTYDSLDRPEYEYMPDPTSGSEVVKTFIDYTDTNGAVSVQKEDRLNSGTTKTSYIYFDGFGRSIQVRSGAETTNQYNVRDFVFGNDGLLAKESLPYVSTGSANTTPTSNPVLYTLYGYDPLLRVIVATTTVGTIKTSYDQWVETVTDALGTNKNFSYDAYVRLATTTEKNSTSTYNTAYQWDQNNNLIKITDALGNVRNITYDGLSRRTKLEDLHASADSTFGKWYFAYDASNNLSSTTNPKGQVINYTYDDINRVLTENYLGGAGTEVTYVYDTCTRGEAQLCSAVNVSTTATYIYDYAGNIDAESKVLNGVTYTTGYDYDRQGNQTSIIYPDNSEVKYTFNKANQIEKVEQRENGGSFRNIISNFDYGPHGQMTYQLFGNGASTTKSYDANELYRLRSIITSSTSTLGVGGGGLALAQGEEEMLLMGITEDLATTTDSELDKTISDAITTPETISTDAPPEVAQVEKVEEMLVPEVLPTEKQGPYTETADTYELDVVNSDKIEISKTKPEVRLQKWNGEVNLGVSYNNVTAEAERASKTDRIEWKGDVEEVHAYPLAQSKEMEHGGFEIEVVLNEQPKANTFEFQLDGTDNLDFFYQPALNEEVIVGETCTATQCTNAKGEITSERAENIVGSYAVYHKEKRNHIADGTNYESGKAFHIFRPKIHDALGNKVWGILTYAKGILTVTVPEEFLKAATYPVVVDPTFGYTTAGGSSKTLSASNFDGSLFTTPSGYASFTSLSLYCGLAAGTSHNVKAMVVTHSSLNLVSNGVSNAIACIPTAGWKTPAFGTAPNLTASTEYLLGATGDTGGRIRLYYDTGTTDQGHLDSTNVYTTPANLGSITHSTNKYSIYGTYSITANATPTAPTVLQTEGVTNPINVTDSTPEFSAIFNDPDAGNVATKYQIQVSTSTTFTNIKWNSGIVALATSTPKGSRNTPIAYSGTSTLASSTYYYWRIKFWDGGNKQGAWSTTTASFWIASGEPIFSIFKERIQNLKYTYDAVGNITKIVDRSDTLSAATTTYTYDTLYRLKSASTTNASLGGYRQTYSYDALGNITNKSDKGVYSYLGNTGSNFANPHAVTSLAGVTYKYDKNGNLASTTANATYGWDYVNRLLTSIVASTTSSYSYDYTGQRVKKIAVEGTAGNTGFMSPSATGNLYNEWTWSAPSNAYSSNNTYASGVGASAGNEQDYYNFSLSVPSGAVIKGIELQVELNAALGHTDSLDAKLSWNGGSSLTASKSNSWTNQEVYKSYGSSTELWGRTWTATEFNNTNFRVYFNQPSNWYGYGVDHLRVKVSYIVPAGSGGTGTTTTMYPNNLYEVTGTTSTKNIYAGDMLVASIELDTPVPKIYYTHLDHLGSTNVVTDEIGYMGQLLSYHPFGSPRVEEQYGGMIQKNQFIGQDYDSESQLSYLNARYYDGARGQFLSQDPMFLSTDQNLMNPQSLNSYSYAENNPVNRKDPSGLKSKSANAVTQAQIKSLQIKVIGLMKQQVELIAKKMSNSVSQFSSSAAKGAFDPVGGVQTASNKSNSGSSRAGATVGSTVGIVGSFIAPEARGAQGGLRGAQVLLKNAKPVGSALKSDLFHRAPTFMREQAADFGTQFVQVGKDGSKYVVIQIEGKVNDAAGVFEYVTNSVGDLTHQLFKPGGTIDGIIN